MAGLLRSALRGGALAGRVARSSAAWAPVSAASTANYFHSSAAASLNVHEHSSMELMQKFGIPAPQGRVATTAEEAEEIYSSAALARPTAAAYVTNGGGGRRWPRVAPSRALTRAPERIACCLNCAVAARRFPHHRC